MSTSFAEAPLEDQPSVVQRLSQGIDPKQGAMRGAAWTGGARVGSQILQFAISLITARILVPGDYGLAAIVVSISSFASIFTDLGLGAAVIHVRHLTEEILSSAFWLNAGSGFILTGLISGLALPLSDFYRTDHFVPLLLLGSLNFSLSMGVVQTALLERTFNFRRLAFVETIALAVGLAAQLGAAIAGAGVFSLVVGPLSITVVQTTLLWTNVRWVPRQRPSRRAIGELWHFSRGITGFNALNFWSRNLDNLLLGRAASVKSLGEYSRAYSLMTLPVQQMSLVLGRVLYPSLTRLRDDPPRMGRAWLRGLGAAGALTMPVTLTIAVTAPSFIRVLYGSRWVGMTVVLELLATAALPQIIAATTGGLLRAAGRTGLLFKLGLISSSLSVLAIVLGLPWGATGVAAALLIKFWLALPIAVMPCLRITQLRIRDLARPFRATAPAAAALVVAEMGVRLGVRSLPAWEVLGGEVLAGATAYLIVMLLLDPTLIRSLIRRASSSCRTVLGRVRQSVSGGA